MSDAVGMTKGWMTFLSNKALERACMEVAEVGEGVERVGEEVAGMKGIEYRVSRKFASGRILELSLCKR